MEFYNHTLKAVAEGRAEMVALGKYPAYASSCFCMIMFANSIISSIDTFYILCILCKNCFYIHTSCFIGYDVCMHSTSILHVFYDMMFICSLPSSFV